MSKQRSMEYVLSAIEQDSCIDNCAPSTIAKAIRMGFVEEVTYLVLTTEGDNELERLHGPTKCVACSDAEVVIDQMKEPERKPR